MELKNFLNDLRSTTSTLKKISILKSYDSLIFRYLIICVYHPFLHFNVRLTEKDHQPTGHETIEYKFEKIKKVFDFCFQSKSAKQNKNAVKCILDGLDFKSQELLICVINKDLKVGVGSNLFLEAYPDLIIPFEVQLANKYNEVFKKKSFSRKDRLISPKLDGIRCIFLREHKEWKAYSRQGKEFFTLDHIKEELEKIYKNKGFTFWDGEIYKHGIPFNEIQSAVSSFTKGTAVNLEYHTFICGDEEDFWNQNFSGMVQSPNLENKIVIAVTQFLIKDEDIYDYLEKYFELGYEGIMLRDPDRLYSFGRDSYLLKLKEGAGDHKQEEKEIDCVVVDIEYKDDFPILENGKIEFKRLLNKILVKQSTYNDLICKVGSGFDLKFRKFYTTNPEDLMGKTVEIKFQDYGSKGLMRFPRFKRVREDIA